MRKIIVVCFLCILFCNNIFPLDTAAVKYFPLQIGNSWVYTFTEYPSFYTHRFRRVITGTSVMNGHLYYSIDEYGINSRFVYYIRYDSIQNTLKKISSAPCPWLNNEVSWDSISSHYNDSSTFNCDVRYRCSDTGTITIFNTIFRKKSFYALYDYGYRTRNFAQNIGLTSIWVSGMSGTYSEELNGCIVNGAVYGDTSLVGINHNNSEFPSGLCLSQNYPNPFNPVTKIKFQIPASLEASRRDVLIAIYDVLGKQVAVLVNQLLHPGTYEADWDASAFPSGIYYYKLKVETSRREVFTETKKMVLIK